jgi:hypothetical protein
MRLIVQQVAHRQPERRTYYIDEVGAYYYYYYNNGINAIFQVVRSIYDPDKHFIVDKVLKQKIINGRRKYYVKFAGYKGPKSRMWIDEDDMLEDAKNITS